MRGAQAGRIRAAIAIAVVCGTAATAPAALAAYAGVENGVLVLRNGDTGQVVDATRISDSSDPGFGGIRVIFSGPQAPVATAGPGCSESNGGGFACMGATSVEFFSRNEFLGNYPSGDWIWEEVHLAVPLPATVHGGASRQKIDHLSEEHDANGAPKPYPSPMTIEGGSHEDDISGGDGPDLITGGAGVDWIKARGGDDKIYARDGAKDSIVCGKGYDRVEADAVEQWPLNPENWCEEINGVKTVNGALPKAGSTTKKGGKCATLKGKKRSACVKKNCSRYKGKGRGKSAKKYKACVKKVTRK